MDWFDRAFTGFYAIPLRARACFGVACMFALIWLPLGFGLMRAFSERPDTATVQSCYRDWWACVAKLFGFVKRGEQGK